MKLIVHEKSDRRIYDIQPKQEREFLLSLLEARPDIQETPWGYIFNARDTGTTFEAHWHFEDHDTGTSREAVMRAVQRYLNLRQQEPDAFDRTTLTRLVRLPIPPSKSSPNNTIAA